jgi:serine protease Do
MLKDKGPSPPTERPFERIVGDVRLAVVSTDVVAAAADVPSSADKTPRPPDGLEDFFNKRFGTKGAPKRATASGLIVSADGYVVTAYAAVADAKGVKVRVDGKGALTADVMGVDDRTGVALLKIRQTGTWPFVPLGSNAAKLGDPIFAIGSAFGLSGTALKGHVTGLDRDIGYSLYNFAQTDITFPKDDFLGSPLFDMRGSVVGIVTAKGMGEKASIVFAFPARDVLAVVEQLKVHGTLKRGWLGVRIQNVDENMTASLGLSEAKGALVAEVQVPSPAAAAGIKRGDTILSVNGAKIADSRELSRQIARFKPDTTVALKLMRALKEETVQVKLGLLLPPLAASKPAEAPTQGMWFSQLGLSVKVDRGVAKEGVVVTEVEPASVVAQRLKVGDVVLKADNRPVNSVEDLLAVIGEANQHNRRAVLLLIRSGGATRFEPVPLRRSN